MMSGQFGIHNGAVNHGGEHADPWVQGQSRGFRTDLARHSLPATLKKRGLSTCYIGPFAERHSTFTFYAGFREIHDTGKGGAESAEDVTPTVLEWIETNGRKDDWYLHVHYWDPHTPYRAPKEFGNPFAKDPLPGFFTPDLIDRHRRLPGPKTIQDINMWDNSTRPEFPRQPGEVRDMAEMHALIDGYDCAIRYMDGHIGSVLKAIGDAGVLDDVAIIISADHGENFGELGLYSEHGTADVATCRVPMIVRWPGGAVGHTDTGLHYNIDMAPTYAELLGTEREPEWDGKSFARAVSGGGECGRSEIILSQNSHVLQRSVRWDAWLYIRTYHDGFHLWPREMLFSLDVDPYEQENVAAENAPVCREGAYRLMSWHDDMMLTMPYEHYYDPMWKVLQEGGPYHARGQLKDYLGRLRATGRGEAAAQLAARYPREMGGGLGRS
jgi:arylsulfatase A-like enzyme